MPPIAIVFRRIVIIGNTVKEGVRIAISLLENMLFESRGFGVNGRCAYLIKLAFLRTSNINERLLWAPIM